MGKLTVLGREGGFPRANGACSGYLVEAGNACIVCDLGSGTLSRLNGLLPVEKLDALLLSHLHFDHCSDVLVLQYQLEAAMKSGVRKTPLPLYLPDTPADVRALFEQSDAFALHSIWDGMKERFGKLTVTFSAVRHGRMEAYAMDIRLPEGRRLFYTGDTGWFEGLTDLAKGADTLLCDTAFLNARADGAPLPHLTTGEASRLAKEAGVGRLLCTHLSGGGDMVPYMEKEIDFTPGTVIQELGQYEV